ncbi:MAG: host attachment protein [Alphaproteobacteria bacterium]|nr:host attachment protein [Alphaproteobacteria bacterium]
MPPKGGANKEQCVTAHNRTWNVVADASRAQILHSDERGRDREPLILMCHVRPDRAFARTVAHHVDRGALGGDHDHLLLIAPNETLGDFRNELGACSERRLVGEATRTDQAGAVRIGRADSDDPQLLGLATGGPANFDVNGPIAGMSISRRYGPSVPTAVRRDDVNSSRLSTRACGNFIARARSARSGANTSV